MLKAGQALPQKGKMDLLVDWAAELGVQELWAMETKRTIVKMKKEARERAQARWERIAIEACKQSRSSVLTQMKGPLPFEKILREKIQPGDRPFIFHPDPDGLSFSEFIEEARRFSTNEDLPSVFLFFGPEGGFTEAELDLAKSHGVRKVFLGDFILRMEAAFLAVLGSLRFLMPRFHRSAGLNLRYDEGKGT